MKKFFIAFLGFIIGINMCAQVNTFGSSTYHIMQFNGDKLVNMDSYKEKSIIFINFDANIINISNSNNAEVYEIQNVEREREEEGTTWYFKTVIRNTLIPVNIVMEFKKEARMFIIIGNYTIAFTDLTIL